jgi:hypothetical protein
MLILLSWCTYQRALNKLEQLFVQRLLELTKLGMNSVGAYTLKLALKSQHLDLKFDRKQMHEKIGKALNTHAEAI